MSAVLRSQTLVPPTGPTPGAVPGRGNDRVPARVTGWEAGVLVAGLGAGVPAAVVEALAQGDLGDLVRGLLVVPAVAGVVGVAAWHLEGSSDGARRAMAQSLICRRQELAQFLAGVLVTLVCLGWLLGGDLR
jgi:hypothetical protein